MGSQDGGTPRRPANTQHVTRIASDTRIMAQTISKISSSRGKSPSSSATLKRAKSSVSSQAPRSTVRPQQQWSKSAATAGSSSSLPTSAENQCACCGSASVQLKHVTRSFGEGAALLVIEAVPMWRCPSCGESYFSAQTMHAIERIKALRKSVAVDRSVPVAAFEATAA